MAVAGDFSERVKTKTHALKSSIDYNKPDETKDPDDDDDTTRRNHATRVYGYLRHYGTRGLSRLVGPFYRDFYLKWRERIGSKVMETSPYVPVILILILNALFLVAISVLTLFCGISVIFSPVLMFVFGAYYYYCTSKPRLYYNPNSARSRKILSHCKILRERYWPTPYAINGHAQTLAADLLKAYANLKFDRKCLTMKDQGTIALDFLHADHFTTSTPTVLVLCGLSGSSCSNYIRNLMALLQHKGYRAVCLNARGTGDTELKTPVSFNPAKTDDCREAIRYLHKKYPSAPIFAVGYSLGANILTKYLAQEGEQSTLKAAICISGPFDFIICSTLFKKTMVRAYDRILTRSMTNYVEKHKSVFGRNEDLDLTKVQKCCCIREFDKEFTIKVFGYRSIDSYYKDASTRPLIPKIYTPTLFINAMNDPLIDPNVLPYASCSENPYTILCATNTGGHIGWPEGLLKVKDFSWTDKVCVEYLSANLKLFD